MRVQVRSPDFRIDDVVFQGVVVRSLTTALARFAGQIASIRIHVSAVQGGGEAPRTRCRIRVKAIGVRSADVIVAHVARDFATAVVCAAARAEASVARALTPAPVPVH